MTTYRATYYRRYLPHPECDEPQHGQIVTGSEAQVRDILADCEVTHIEAVDETAQVNAELATLTPTTTEQDVDDLRTIIETLDTADWLGEVTALQYGDYDLGTRFTISGGEVMELDSYLESRYDEANGDIDLPF
jgi:hypothetical protein